MGKAESPKLPRGVTIRKHSQGETINITFTYRGVKCREPLSNLEVNSKNLKYAERTLGEIHNKIERGTFVYAEYFPRSARLKLFGNAAAGKTVKKYLDEYIDICETRKLSPSTIGGYKKCRSALAALHSLPASELTPAASLPGPLRTTPSGSPTSAPLICLLVALLFRRGSQRVLCNSLLLPLCPFCFENSPRCLFLSLIQHLYRCQVLLPSSPLL